METLPSLYFCLLGALTFLLLWIELRSGASSLKHARLRTYGWIGLAIAFGLGIYVWKSSTSAEEFFAGYLLEYALSVDNLFVFLLIFKAFKLVPEQQHRVLFWGLFGAAGLRALFIFAGLELAEHFRLIFVLFGFLLLYSSLKLLRESFRATEASKEASLRNNSSWFQWIQRHLPVADASSVAPHSTQFQVIQEGKKKWTQLFLVLIFVEVTDLAFAVDSIPAVFGVSHDRLVVLSSNLFAILGLRSLFIVLSHALSSLRTLPYALSAILAFVGIKMMLEPWVSISIATSLGVIIGMLLLAMAAHLFGPKER